MISSNAAFSVGRSYTPHPKNLGTLLKPSFNVKIFGDTTEFPWLRTHSSHQGTSVEPWTLITLEAIVGLHLIACSNITQTLPQAIASALIPCECL